MDGTIKNLIGAIEPLMVSWREEVSQIRTNRPTPHLVEDIVVDYAGVPMKIKQLGSISVSPPRDIQISIWDKSVVGAVAKALELSPLGLLPSVDANIVRISLPPLTSERRAEIAKIMKGTAEKVRIRLRMIRDEVNKDIVAKETNKEITEDQKFSLKDEVQEIITKFNKEIDLLLEQKVSEINEL